MGARGASRRRRPIDSLGFHFFFSLLFFFSFSFRLTVIVMFFRQTSSIRSGATRLFTRLRRTIRSRSVPVFYYCRLYSTPRRRPNPMRTPPSLLQPYNPYTQLKIERDKPPTHVLYLTEVLDKRCPSCRTPTHLIYIAVSPSGAKVIFKS